MIMVDRPVSRPRRSLCVITTNSRDNITRIVHQRLAFEHGYVTFIRRAYYTKGDLRERMRGGDIARTYVSNIRFVRYANREQRPSLPLSYNYNYCSYQIGWVVLVINDRLAPGTRRNLWDQIGHPGIEPVTPKKHAFRPFGHSGNTF